MNLTQQALKETIAHLTRLDEGGAVGHLMHLYDNDDLTFAEIKHVLSQAASGELENVTEKLDGMNLVFTWDVQINDVRVARNSGDIKGGGMDADALAKKFFGRGNVADAFNGAFNVLRQAVGSLPEGVKTKVFGPAGNKWYSIEIIYTSNPNVINYDMNNVVFHGWPVFKANAGEVKRIEGRGVEMLSKHIEKMQNAVAERNWKINGPRLIRLKKLGDGSILDNVLSRIDDVMAAAGVNDSSTMGDYMYSRAADEVDRLGLPDDASAALVSRLSGGEDSASVNALKKVTPRDKLPEVLELVKREDELRKSWIQPIEQTVHDFAIEALRGLSSTLISKSDEEVARLRSEVQGAIDAIRSSGSEKAMGVLQQQLHKLGDVENIAAAMEGVVFIYKGNAYKFTGAFAPANQILGLFRYGRG